jgi:ABC-type polysaccharide/polyol phosphate transport system ATPase subunit
LDNITVEVSDITKIYKLYDKPTDRLRESINPFKRKYHHDFFALKNISFSIKQGETFGIIGSNGSGKSTILKIITGILNPTAGQVLVKGKVSALLELGTGFNLEYTGLENIYVHGALVGFTREQMTERLDSIIQFADIGDFIYQPVKTYSSGMFVRLAFAVAINVDPDVLIIDEALSVGDVRFQQKCLRKIEEFRLAGKTVIFVSHDLATIVKFCDRVIWLNNGILEDEGGPLEIAKKFQAHMMGSPLVKYTNEGEQKEIVQSTKKHVIPLDGNLDMHGDHRAIITGISIADYLSQENISILSAGQKVSLSIGVKFLEDMDSPIVGFSIKDRLGNITTQTNSYVLNNTMDSVPKDFEVVFQFTFTVPTISDGYYSISPAVASGNQSDHVQHCWVHDALVVEVISSQLYKLPGLIFLDTITCNYSV